MRQSVKALTEFKTILTYAEMFAKDCVCMREDMIQMSIQVIRKLEFYNYAKIFA